MNFLIFKSKRTKKLETELIRFKKDIEFIEAVENSRYLIAVAKQQIERTKVILENK